MPMPDCRQTCQGAIQNRMDNITSFLAMDVMERGMQMARGERPDVVQLSVGEPDFDAPDAVVTGNGALAPARRHALHR
ncbi:MAG: hypothetical protein R3A47_01640 [Polyangiales bacterium]